METRRYAKRQLTWFRKRENINWIYIDGKSRADIIKEAADIIRGHKVAKNVRVIVIPATQEIYVKAMKEGLLADFIEAGCVVSTPTCGPCLGGHMGILAPKERAVATTNRNFVGRMGDPTSEVYLASPAVAAASAILGRIASPEEIGGND